MNYKLCYTFAPYIIIQQRKLNIHYNYPFKNKVYQQRCTQPETLNFELTLCVALQA